MESLIAGAAAALIGVLSGQTLALKLTDRESEKRLQALENAVPELISRSEVQNAFAEMARLEAARIQQEQQQAQQLARQQMVFRERQQTQRRPATAELNAQMNQQLEEQLAMLQQRMSELQPPQS